MKVVAAVVFIVTVISSWADTAFIVVKSVAMYAVDSRSGQ